MSNKEISAGKAELRRHYRALRQQLSSETQHECAQQLSIHIQQHNLIDCLVRQDLNTEELRVALYIENDGELGTVSLIEYLWSIDVRVYLPIVDIRQPGHLVFAHYHAKSAMQLNKYGIKEPVIGETECVALHNLNAVFLPLVAFDENGNRLGMGGGYYDRSLSLLTENNRPRLIGLAHDIQKADNLAAESWDIPLDEIFTPKQRYQINGA